jgi:hypothetical protein
MPISLLKAVSRVCTTREEKLLGVVKAEFWSAGSLAANAGKQQST